MKKLQIKKYIFRFKTREKNRILLGSLNYNKTKLWIRAQLYYYKKIAEYAVYNQVDQARSQIWFDEKEIAIKIVIFYYDFTPTERSKVDKEIKKRSFGEMFGKFRKKVNLDDFSKKVDTMFEDIFGSKDSPFENFFNKEEAKKDS